MAGDCANGATWALVLLGWYVVHRTTLLRERRKENRESVAQLIHDIKATEELAVRFNTAEQFEPLVSESVIWQTSRIIRTLQRKPLKDLNIPLTLMVKFRRGLTLMNTDASSFQTQTCNGDVVIGIRSITDRMIEAVEAARDKHFT